MGARYDNIGGIQHKVSKRYDNINGVFRPVSKRCNNVAGVWRQGYSKAIAWTSAVNVISGYGYVGIRNNNGYSGWAEASATSENMAKRANIIYTFAEPLQMPEGSTVYIEASSTSYPEYWYVYVNDVSVATFGADGAKYVSYVGSITSVKLECSFGNGRSETNMGCKATVNPAGSNSFMLDNANSADL